MKLFIAFDITEGNIEGGVAGYQAFVSTVEGAVGSHCLVQVALMRVADPPPLAEPARSLLGVRVRRSTAMTVASEAKARGVSQKSLLLRGLLAQGIWIHPLDLEDQRPPQQSGKTGVDSL